MIKELSEREKEVLLLLVEGLDNPKIAEKLIISVHTAKQHVCNIMNKFGVDNRTQIVTTAFRARLVK